MFTKNAIIKMSAGIVGGGLLGFAYYYFWGCQGSCPITSNWLTTTLVGGAFGLVMMFPSGKGNRQ